MNKNIIDSTTDLDDKYNSNFVGDVNFTMGPVSIYQFNLFADHGLCALRLFQYIKTKQGLVYGKKPEFKGKDTCTCGSILIIKIYIIGLDFINLQNGSC